MGTLHRYGWVVQALEYRSRYVRLQVLLPCRVWVVVEVAGGLRSLPQVPDRHPVDSCWTTSQAHPLGPHVAPGYHSIYHPQQSVVVAAGPLAGRL